MLGRNLLVLNWSFSVYGRDFLQNFNSECLELHLKTGRELNKDDYVSFDALKASALSISYKDVLVAASITFPHNETYKL